MKFGYARVSKNEQSLDVQIQKLTAAGCDEIFQEKNDLALRSITSGEYELNEISKTRPYCARIAPQTKTFLARVITLKSELEMLGCENLRSAG